MTDQEIRLKFGEMNAGEMLLARALVAWHEREIAKLKDEIADVVLAQAVRRMEAVPKEELCDAYEAAYTSYGGMGAVRARLILAFKGEGQPVVVNESPQDERQPDLSGENEKQAEPSTFEAHGKVWTRHTPGNPMPCEKEKRIYWLYRDTVIGSTEDPDVIGWERNEKKSSDIIGWRYADEPAQAQQGPAQPWTPTVGQTVRLKSGGPAMVVTHVDPLSLMCAWMNADDELQVEPITTLCLEPAKEELTKNL